MNPQEPAYEELLIDYLHGELPAEQAEKVKHLIETNAEVRADWELLQQTVLEADEALVFEPKAQLYKTEIKKGWQIHIQKYYAAAAMLFVLLGLFFLLLSDNENTSIAITPSSISPTTNAIHKNTEKDTITSSINIASNRPRLNKKQGIAEPLPASIVKRQNTRPQAKTTLSSQAVIPTSFQSENNVALIDSTLQKRLYTPQPATAKDTNIVLAQQLPEVKPNEVLDANKASALVWNETKKPGLFKTINYFLNAKKKLRTTIHEVSQTEVLVYVGQKKIIQLN